jgi:hypothetical protein
MARKIKWTHEVYTLLYRTMTERFGPYYEWEASKCPSKKQEEEFNDFLESIRDLAGATSTDAVLNQIQWAITRQPSAKGVGHVRLLMSNKTFAAREGFIDGRYIPMALSLKMTYEK